jgi:UPF0755 protein
MTWTTGGRTGAWSSYSFVNSGTVKAFIRILSAVLGMILGAAVVFLILNSNPAALRTGERLFLIHKGETLTGIADRLQSEGFIRFAPLLRVVSKLKSTEGSFKAGYYQVPAGATTLQIHRLLVQGAATLEKVTIPEGWTVRKIADLLEKRGICPAEDFIQAAGSPLLAKDLGVPAPGLEGYLFPDTYFMPKPFPPEALIGMMVDAFFQNLTEIAPGHAAMERERLHETIILSSIVEREYRIAEEAPLIASVFKNRLALNIGLESCATLEYILTEIQHKAHPEYITLEDEKIDSPYNTYKWAGLPPGPISNPGRTALDAAFNPARTDYLYFLLRDQASGRHYFSRNLDEHNQAKHLYLKN